MLDKENKSIDAVSVSTPDNVHAVAAFAAMQLGKHVYVQKPLAIHHNQYYLFTQVNRNRSRATFRRLRYNIFLFKGVNIILLVHCLLPAS